MKNAKKVIADNRQYDVYTEQKHRPTFLVARALRLLRKRAARCADSNDNDNSAVGVGDTVQITSEAACPACGGKIGTVSKKHSRGYCIKCKECKKQICDLGDCTFIVIG